MNNKWKKEILLINKPLNWTSNDVVQKVKRVLKVKKVGHAGTLDPLASGLLILGINEGTKLLSSFILDKKEYRAEIIFGFNTKSFDMEFEPQQRTEFIPNIQEIIFQLEKWKKEYYQTPPIFSALKQQGKKLYELARESKTIEIPQRLVYLYDYFINSFENNILDITIQVSKGFYVRSFANELGLILNSLATLKSLVRTKVGNFDLKEAIEIKDVYEYWNKL